MSTKIPLLRHHILRTCHRWRACAMGIPRMWSYIMITDKLPPKRFLSAWLARSACVPLHLDIADTGEMVQRVAGIFEVLEPHFWRVLTLRIHFVSFESTAGLLPFIYTLSHLEELDMSWSSKHRPRQPPISVFQETPTTLAPNLRKFTISTACVVRNAVNIATINAGQLTSLSVNEAVSFPNMVAVLKQCTSLQDLTWDMLYIEADSTDNILRTLASLVLPSLSRLEINGPPTATILGNVQMPCLHRLHVSTHENPTADFLSCVLKHEGVTHLRLDWFGGLPAERVESIFTTLKHLEHFRFMWGASTLPAIKILSETVEGLTGPSWHCPRMRRLFVDIGNLMIPGQARLSATDAAEVFSSVVQARPAGGDAPLTIVVDQCEGTEGLTTLVPGLELRPRDEFLDV